MNLDNQQMNMMLKIVKKSNSKTLWTNCKETLKTTKIPKTIKK